jgi:antitoxin component of MazEF toxin-antitoxin module
LTSINITLQGIQLGEYIVVQFNLLSEHKRRFGVDELQGEMNKTKPTTFDGEHKKDEDAKTWLLGMRKYF